MLLIISLRILIISSEQALHCLRFRRYTRLAHNITIKGLFQPLLLAVSENEEICTCYGGDEFGAAAIIPTDIVQQYIAAFKKRFRAHLAHYNNISERPYDIEASIGYYITSLSELLDIEQTMKYADDMMYAEKLRRKKQRL